MSMSISSSAALSSSGRINWNSCVMCKRGSAPVASKWLRVDCSKHGIAKAAALRTREDQ